MNNPLSLLLLAFFARKGEQKVKTFIGLTILLAAVGGGTVYLAGDNGGVTGATFLEQSCDEYNCNMTFSINSNHEEIINLSGADAITTVTFPDGTTTMPPASLYFWNGTQYDDEWLIYPGENKLLVRLPQEFSKNATVDVAFIRAKMPPLKNKKVQM
jgi:hypothetical protein